MANCEPIFIVGVPRSGTTLLQLVLSSHSRIAIAPETHFFRLFWSKRVEYGDLSDNQNFNRVCEDLVNCEYMRNLQIPDYEEKIRGVGRNAFYSDVFRLLLEEYACKNEKERCGEKTPCHLEYVAGIFDTFPEARVINIFRNPFDVAASIKGVPWGEQNVIDISKRWRKYVGLAMDYQERFGDKFCNVRYEDLVSKPASIVGGICDFLDMEFESNMLRHNRTTNDVPVFNKDKYWHETCFQPISAINIGKGFGKLDFGEVRFIKHFCRGYLELLEYNDLLKDYEERFRNRTETNTLFNMIEGLKFRYALFVRNEYFREVLVVLKRVRDYFR